MGEGGISSPSSINKDIFAWYRHTIFKPHFQLYSNSISVPHYRGRYGNRGHSLYTPSSLVGCKLPEFFFFDIWFGRLQIAWIFIFFFGSLIFIYNHNLSLIGSGLTFSDVNYTPRQVLRCHSSSGSSGQHHYLRWPPLRWQTDRLCWSQTKQWWQTAAAQITADHTSDRWEER